MTSTFTVGELYEQVRDGRIISDIELQREIIYNDDKQALVIDSIVNGIPLPAFYFWRNSDGVLEVLDGKQRIEAIKRFKENDIMYQSRLWKQTSVEVQEAINSTPLSVIICEGDEPLKREIFKRINTLGVPLSPYEVLNGLFHGEYLRGLTAYVENDRYAKRVLGGNSRGKNQLRVTKWLIVMSGGKPSPDALNEYVSTRQSESFEDDQRTINRYMKFVGEVFTDFGQSDIYFSLALKYVNDVTVWKDKKSEINLQITRFLKSDAAKLLPDKAKEIEDIIQAVVSGISVDPKRLFTEDDKAELLAKAERDGDKFRCAICRKCFLPDELTLDHVEPWSRGGRTELSNAQLLCRPCNSKKGNY
ncbi:MAG: DUF262 domain-containing protein [Actinobacteria bacterium]|nr:MAG: DUF262 domain-containing protein [Actinomycetota bacterium]